MRIGIIGPSSVTGLCKVLDVEESEYLYFLEKVSEHLASTEHELVMVPNIKSAPTIIANAYKDFRGKKIYGLVPQDDSEFGIAQLDLAVPDDIINCKTWRNQPEMLCEISDVLLVVGLSPGTMTEICYSKWFKVRKVFILEDFISSKLHPELEKDLNLEYLNIDSLITRIK